jgi:hemoglobin
LALLWCCIFATAGCGQSQKQNKDFYTSGDSEADERAEQRMAQAEQLNGVGEGAGDKPATTESKRSLYDRLGAEQGIASIVEDFVSRAMSDPRVNWNRHGIVRGGFSFHFEQSMEWKPTSDEIKAMKQHMAQFLSLATGGPSNYQGQEMKSAHSNMHIDNTEFDAAVGDMKATLDKLQIANTEQKELLAIIETTRAEIVEER